MVHFSACCSPIRGEPIIGVVTRNRGVTIHSRECMNLAQVNSKRFLPASWGERDDKNTHYPVELEIKTIDRQGLLKDVITKLTDNKANILAANIQTFANHTALIGVVVEVENIEQLKNIMLKIKQISDVLNVNRVLKPSKALKQFTEKNATVNKKSNKSNKKSTQNKRKVS